MLPFQSPLPYRMDPGKLQILLWHNKRAPDILTMKLPEGFSHETRNYPWNPIGWSVAESSVIVLCRWKDSALSSWWHRLCRRPTTHQSWVKVSLTSGAYQVLPDIPLKAQPMSVSPDGKQLLYWVEREAFLLDL